MPKTNHATNHATNHLDQGGGMRVRGTWVPKYARRGAPLRGGPLLGVPRDCRGQTSRLEPPAWPQPAVKHRRQLTASQGVHRASRPTHGPRRSVPSDHFVCAPSLGGRRAVRNWKRVPQSVAFQRPWIQAQASLTVVRVTSSERRGFDSRGGGFKHRRVLQLFGSSRIAQRSRFDSKGGEFKLRRV